MCGEAINVGQVPVYLDADDFLDAEQVVKQTRGVSAPDREKRLDGSGYPAVADPIRQMGEEPDLITRDARNRDRVYSLFYRSANSKAPYARCMSEAFRISYSESGPRTHTHA